MLKDGTVLEAGSVQEDALVGEQIIDSVQPFLGFAAAALEDETLLILHLAKLVGGDGCDAHNCIPPN